MNVNVGHRIRQARKLAGMTQPALAAKIGVTKSSVSQWERGDIKNIEGDHLLRLSQALHVRPEWLQYGRGHMEINNNNKDKEIERVLTPLCTVPLIEWHEVKNKHRIILGGILTSAQVSKLAFALVVKGDSMVNPHGSPSIPDGYIIIVDPEQIAVNNDLVIAFVDGSEEPTFKRLVIDGSRRYLKALNPSYPAIEVDDNCLICGKVVKIEFEP